jgi:hypothetical protein
MSGDTTSHHRGHAIAWVGAPLLLLALYVGTWPVVEIKASIHTLRVEVKHRGKVTAIRTQSPEWVKTLYQPLHRLCLLNGGKNPLLKYWNWCHTKIGAPPVFPEWLRALP